MNPLPSLSGKRPAKGENLAWPRIPGMKRLAWIGAIGIGTRLCLIMTGCGGGGGTTMPPGAGSKAGTLGANFPAQSITLLVVPQT